jgi:molybdopterin synthase sulfur carrier subunit
MIRLVLPLQLCNLASASREITLDMAGPASISTVLDALEVRYPMLRGTIRDQITLQRRPFIRFFACGEDLSLEPATDPLPEEVASGKEPLRVVGAMAGG